MIIYKNIFCCNDFVYALVKFNQIHNLFLTTGSLLSKTCWRPLDDLKKNLLN